MLGSQGARWLLEINPHERNEVQAELRKISQIIMPTLWRARNSGSSIALSELPCIFPEGRTFEHLSDLSLDATALGKL